MSLSHVKMVEKKGDGLSKKNGRKCKQREMKTGGEMEVTEGEVSEIEVCTEGQDKDESVTVGVTIFGESGPLPFG